MSYDDSVRVYRRPNGTTQIVPSKASTKAKLERCLAKHPLGSPKHRLYREQLDALLAE